MHIELKDINKRFPKANADSLSISSLNFIGGEVVGVIGHNGAGKSTLLNLISSAIIASGGEYLLNGTDITHNPEVIRYRLGYFADPERSLYLRLTAAENIARFCVLKGLPKNKEVSARIDELAERFSLSAHMHRQVRFFSKGMKVKLNLIMSFLGNNELIIMDEPFAGLDGNVIIDLMEIVSEEARAGKLILISSNELSELELICSRIIALNKGMLVFDGTLSGALSMIPGDSAIEVYDLNPVELQKRLLADARLSIVHSVVSYDKVTMFSVSPINDFTILTESGCKAVLRNKNLYDFVRAFCIGGSNEEN